MNNINLFFILIIALIVLLFLLVILLIIFRNSIDKHCCGSRAEEEEARNHNGLRNLAFDDQEHPGLVSARPFSSMEAVDTPPSYEEAIKQELFRFGLPPSQRPRSDCPANAASSNAVEVPSISSSCEQPVTHTATSPLRNTLLPSLPSTSHVGVPHCSRSRSSTGSSCPPTLLSTIEEEIDECPVTVVIDCIGIQASRLMDKCETSVNLTNGSELASHSKC